MLDIFEILGPVMVGPSSSHTAGAVRIGRMGRALLGGEPKTATILLYGSFAETGRGHGTDRALVAGLLGMQPDDLKIPGSFALAMQRGMQVRFGTAHLRDAHPNTVVLELEGENGRTLRMQASSVGGGRIRVDELDGVAVNFTGAFHTLMIRHKDIPGILAEFTRRLSGTKVNIANMSLHRSRRGGDVLTLFETDQPISPETRQRIGEVSGVEALTYYEKEDD